MRGLARRKMGWGNDNGEVCKTDRDMKRTRQRDRMGQRREEAEKSRERE